MVDYMYLRMIMYKYLPEDINKLIGSRRCIFRYFTEEKYIKNDRDYQYLDLVATIADAPEIIIKVYMHSYAYEALFCWYYKDKYRLLMEME